MALLETDVVLWYDIDEGTGTTLDNSEGTASFDGTATGLTWGTGGPTNLSETLDNDGGGAINSGNNEYITTNNTIGELVGTAGDFSIGLTIRLDGTTDNNSHSLASDWGTSDRSILFRYNDSTNLYEFFVSDGGNSELQLSHTDASIESGYVWLVITRTGNNTEMFLNGTSVDTNTGSFTLSTGEDLLFGNSYTSAQAYNGKIAQAFVLNRTIDATEAGDIYNSGDGVTFDGLFAPPATTTNPLFSFGGM